MMPALPVASDILQAALNLVRPQPESCDSWEVTSERVRCGGFTMWQSEDGLQDEPYITYREDRTALDHLLKPRRERGMRGWSDLTSVQQDTICTAREQQIPGPIWPINAQTGAEYVEACAWYDRVEAELAVSKTPADVQHQRPDVSCHTLLDALEFAMPGGWAVSDAWIQRHQIRFWNREQGADVGDGDYPASCRLVRLLTQLRTRADCPEQLDVDMDIIVAGRKFSGIPYPQHTKWPEDAETGEQYLRFCAHHDYCIAAIAGDSPNDELAEVKEAWSGLIPGVGGIKSTPSKLKTALYRATPYDLSDVSKVKTLVQKHSPVGAQVCVEVNAEDLHMYDIKVGSHTFQYSIPQGATGRIGDPFHGELGGSHIIAPESQQNKPLIHQEHVELEITASDEMMQKLHESCEKFAEQFVKEVRQANEQPWERDKRVAASAGYAHVPAEETKDEYRERMNHECTVRQIKVGHRGGRFEFAHRQPLAPLSGMRINALGWATHGHAVTNPHTCPEAGRGRGPLTQSDMQTQQMYAARAKLAWTGC